MPASGSIYQGGDEAPSDAGFMPGALAHLVAGNHARLLDARRTPVQVVAIDGSCAMFEVEVRAFEDEGARWRMPFEHVERFQFPAAAAVAAPEEVASWEALVERLGEPLEVPVDPVRRAQTQASIAERGREIAAQLAELGVAPDSDAAMRDREADAGAVAAAAEVLASRDLHEMDRRFAGAYVSNPWGAGELVKGHALVAAELGLAPFGGTVVREPDLFDGAWSRERRAEHLMTRVALTAALWRRAGFEEVRLYRAWATETVLDERPSPVFASATFSREVADSLFRPSERTRAAVLALATVPVERLFMTFLETPELSERFKEAEALVLGGLRAA